VGALTLERWDLPKLVEILVGNGRRFRVLDVVPFDEEDSPPPRRAALARRQHAALHCGVLVRGSLAIGDRR
jgi:hypothetical protein